MADNKGYISNKDRKRMELEEEKRKAAYKSPSKTAWGKIVIIILALGMAIGTPLIFFIWYIFFR